MKSKFLRLTVSCSLLPLLLLMATTARADVFIVTNMSNSGAGSLRDAITQANAADGNVIAFSPSLSGTINVSSLMYITKSMTINGNGKVTLSGQNLYSILAITDDATTVKTVTIRGLNFTAGLNGTASNGSAGGTTLSDFTAAQLYGPITSRESLILENVNISASKGGVFISGKSTAIAQPSLTLRNCKFTGITDRAAVASTQGTASANYMGDILIENCLFQGCTFGTVNLQSPNSVIVRNSSFISNSHSSNYGSSLYIRTDKAGTLTTALVENVTVAYASNASNAGGAVYTYIYFNNIPVTFRNCTFYGSTGGPTTSGGSPRQLYFNGANTLNLYNCIIGGTTDGGPDYGASGSGNTFTANFYNCVLGTRNFFSGTGNDGSGNGNVTTNPNLAAAAADNGGFVPTLAFTSASSPAINLGLSANAPATDARGLVRDFAGSVVDAGAYERGSTSFDFVGTSFPVNNTINADISGNLQFNFGHPVSKGSGNIRVYNGSNTLLATIPVTGSDVTLNGNTVSVAAGILPQNTVIYVQMDAGAFNATIDGTSATSRAISNTTSFTFTTGTTSVLPVALIRFSGIPEGRRSKLSWEVGTEEDNDEFLIYRSTAINSYELIASVKGSNGLQRQYSAYDNDPLPGKNLYRLDQKDRNGRQKVLGYAQVNFRQEGLMVQAYPNPVLNDLHITCPDPALLGTRAQLTDMTGKVRSTITLKEQQVISMETFTSGVYLLKMANGQTIKLIRK